MTVAVDVAMGAAELRWREWKAKGRADDLRFRRRLRTVVVDLVAVAAVGGAIWSAFQF